MRSPLNYMANDAAPDRGGPSRNEQIIRAFAGQFNPPLPVVATLKLNNVPARDGWQAAWWSNDRGIGVTAVVHGNGLLHAFIEASGQSDPPDAAEVGKVMAKALGPKREGQ
jgi:hypothetical protein